jgi:hypothetical protein
MMYRKNEISMSVTNIIYKYIMCGSSSEDVIFQHTQQIKHYRIANLRTIHRMLSYYT